MNFYNDICPSACRWTKALIQEGLIPNGDVCDTPIQLLKPHELKGYTQYHFFCGISGWPLAIRMAGWPDDKPVVTGSPPCQPFSVGLNDRAKGRQDERHLLPAYIGHVVSLGVDSVYGEQVSNAIKWGWLDELCDGLENENYSVRALVLPANAFGADHERKRILWCAHSERKRREGHQSLGIVSGRPEKTLSVTCDCFADARRAMDGDFSHLLPSNGVSLQLERDALKGYGNAIVPQVAAAFIRAAEEARIDAESLTKEAGQ